MNNKLQSSLDRLNKVISQGQPTGACCKGGKCTVTTKTACKGFLGSGAGQYLGDGRECFEGLCDPVPSNIGACCQHNGKCYNTTRARCPETLLGYWPKWHAAPCEANPCKKSKLTVPE